MTQQEQQRATSSSLAEFLAGGGEMGERIRAKMIFLPSLLI